MSIRPSGLWCDLCNKPIWSEPYYHIRIQGKEGHACEPCENLYNKIKEKQESAPERAEKLDE